MNQSLASIGDLLQSLPGMIRILNVAILLIAVFFFTSTLASHALEAFVGFINSRGKQLRKRLAVALGADAATELYKGPLIASLSSDGKAENSKYSPSYIEPELFGRAVAGTFASSTALKNSGVLKFLKSEAGEDNAVFESKVVEWFKALNDRQNGTYTRWSFLRLFLIGLAFAVILDIDTVQIAGALWKDPKAAETLVANLEKAMPGTGDTHQPTEEEKQKVTEAVAATWSEIREISPPAYAWQSIPETPVAWGGKALGWLLTGLATSLGAQFWFNLLSETLKLRAAGRKPDEEQAKP